MENKEKRTLTLPLVAGYLPAPLAAAAAEAAERFSLRLYLRPPQELRLTGIAVDDFTAVQAMLRAAGAEFRESQTLPIPRVCSGSRLCRYGKLETEEFSRRLLARFQGWNVKPKLKLAVAACPRNCSSPKLADIGVVATGRGLDLYAGGRAGSRPLVGRKIAAGLDEEGIFAAIETLLCWHNQKTAKRSRMFKHLQADDFPFPFLD